MLAGAGRRAIGPSRRQRLYSPYPGSDATNLPSAPENLAPGTRRRRGSSCGSKGGVDSGLTTRVGRRLACRMAKTATKTPAGDPPNPVDQHVGRRVAERRQALRCSQAQLAQAAGVTFQQVQKYERGANRIAASRLWEMAEFLNVDLNYFFEGLGETKAAVLDARGAATRQTMEIARLAPALSVRNQKLVLDLMHQLAAVDAEADADVEP